MWCRIFKWDCHNAGKHLSPCNISLTHFSSLLFVTLFSALWFCDCMCMCVEWVGERKEKKLFGGSPQQRIIVLVVAIVNPIRILSVEEKEVSATVS